MPTIADAAAFLAERCAVELLDPDAQARQLDGPAELSAAGPHDVTLARTGKRTRSLEDVRAAVLIADEKLDLDVNALCANGVALVARTPDARLEFARLTDALFAQNREPGIHPSANVSPDARLGKGVVIGPGASVGASAIGDDTVINAGARILDGVTIGAHCHVYANAVIGGDGFGFARDHDGTPVKFPQRGSILIGDRVEIGGCTCVDRGALSETVIADDVKIDNLVHIAHNVRIGRGTMIAANAVVAGSSVLGERVWVGPSATISNGLTVGDDASISLGAVVTRDVAPRARMTGNFAVEHERFLAFLRTMR